MSASKINFSHIFQSFVNFSVFEKLIQSAVLFSFIFSCAGAYAQEPFNSVKLHNMSGNNLTIEIHNADNTTLTKIIPNNSIFSFTQLEFEKLPQHVELSIKDDAYQYCNRNGDDYYYPANQPNTPVRYFSVVNNAWAPYNPLVTQPFVKENDNAFSLTRSIIENGGDIFINSPGQCIFNIDPVAAGVIEAAHSGSLSAPNDQDVDVSAGKSLSIDLNKLFADKVIPPTGGQAQINATISPDVPGYSVTRAEGNKPGNLIISDNAKSETIHMFACDPNLNKAISSKTGALPPGVSGLCDGPSGNPSTNTKDNISTESNIHVHVLSGVFAKTPDQIVTDYNKDASNSNLLSTPFKSLNDVSLKNLDSFFQTSGTENNTNQTISLVANDESIPYRVNGNSPWDSVDSKGGAGWGPVIIQNGKDGIPLSSSDFSITNNTLTITHAGKADIKQKLNGQSSEIIQLTLKSSITDASASNSDAFQTIYLIISQNPGFTLLKKHVQAWVYLPNDYVGGSDTPDRLMTNTDAKDEALKNTTQCNYTTTHPGRLEHYLKTVKNSWPSENNSSKYGIGEITPDMTWIGTTYSKSNDFSDLGQFNAANTSGSIGCVASYFKYNMQSKHPIKFVLTEEFDGKLQRQISGLLPMQQQNLIRQLAIATNPIATKAQSAFSSINYYTPGVNDFRLVDGIQFDIEHPFPNNDVAHVFYKGVADMLAREGKVNEIYAFANADTSALIESQGPLGKFLLSSYDVSSQALAAPTGSDHSVFKNPGFWGANSIANTESSTCSSPYSYKGCKLIGHAPTAQDYACHYNSKWVPGKPFSSPYLTNSYCNVDLTNLANGNKQLFSGVDPSDNLDFVQRNKRYGGHFMLSVPSEGSATSWAYSLIIKPEAEPDALDSGKHNVVPMVPDTYVSHYIALPNMDDTKAISDPNSLIASINTYIQSHGYPSAGQYYVFSKVLKADRTCDWSPKSPNSPVLPDSCAAILVTHNPGSTDNDYSRTKNDPLGPLVDIDNPPKSEGGAHPVDLDNLMTIYPSDALGSEYIANNLQVLYDQANTTESSDDSGSSLILKDPPLTPQSNPNNLGVAMFALSDISVENKYLPGLKNQGAIGNLKNSEANKNVINFPVSFPGRSSTNSMDKQRDLWSLTDNYMNGNTGSLTGGEIPQTPTLVPHFIDDTHESFTLQGVKTGTTCYFRVSAPDGINLRSKYSISGNEVTSVTFPLTPYQYNDNLGGEGSYNNGYTLTCTGSTSTFKGNFLRYGTEVKVCFTQTGKMMMPGMQATTTDGTPTCLGPFSEHSGISPDKNISLNPGVYEVSTSPSQVNIDKEDSLGQPNPITPVTVSPKGSYPINLSFSKE